MRRGREQQTLPLADNLGRSWSQPVVIMDFKRNAACLRLERAMANSGRTACVGIWRKALAALAVFVVAHDKVAGEHIHFLPIRVDNGRGRVHAGLDAQQRRAASLLTCFIQVSSENLAIEAVRKTRHCLPTFVEIDSMKFFVL